VRMKQAMIVNKRCPLLRVAGWSACASACSQGGAGGVRMSQWSAIGLPLRNQFWPQQSR
jgi:hypothetical protein